MSSTAGSVAGSRVGGPVTVVMAERRGIFLHLFCYRNADLNVIDSLMNSLSDAFEDLPPVENELEIEGKLLAVKIGGSWLRASGQRNGSVSLIDLGMKKKVALENIRHALPEMQKPQITFWCIVSNFFAHCGENQVEEVMQTMVLELTSLTKLVNKYRFASLKKENQLLELWLEENKYGISTSFLEQNKFFEVDTVDEVVLTAARLGSPQSSLTKDDNLLEASRLLPTHVRVSASLVSAPEGAKLFYIILDQHRSLANLLPNCLAVAPPLRKLPTNGQGCIVPVPLHLGSGWTRGLVVSSNRLSITVTLIDLDMSQISVEASLIKELPSLLKSIPPLVVSVKLAGSDRFSDAAKDTFISLVRNQDLEVKAVGKEDNLQTCTLISASGNILNLMCEKLARSAYREEKLSVGQKEMVQICSLKPIVNGNWSFFVQIVDRRVKMETMQSQVDAYCKGRKGINTQQLFCGDAVFAKWEGDKENKWLRAVVIEHHGRSANVFFVDTGMQGEVDEIRTADLQIVLSLEAQAIECCVKGAEINGHSASVVRPLVNKKVLMMEVLEVMPNNKLVVSLNNLATFPPSDIGQQLDMLTRCPSPVISIVSDSNASTNLPSVFDIAEENLQIANITSSKPQSDGRCSVNSQSSSTKTDHFESVIHRQRGALFSKPGLPEMKSDPALKRPPGSNGFGLAAEIGGVRRKQEYIPEEVISKRNRVETPTTPEPTNRLSFTSMVVYPKSKFKASLSWLVHPAKFYIQANCMLNGLEKMMTTIESLQPDSIPPMRNLVNGQPCLAKFEGAWYRGKVLSYMKDIVDVFFVDYGNMARLPLNSDVKPIVNVNIIELQTIAIPCSLRGVSVGTQWTEKETAELHKLLDNQEFIVKVCGIWNDTYSVIIEVNNRNINLDLKAPPQCLQVLNHVPLMKSQTEGIASISWFVNPSEFFLQPAEFMDKHQKLQNQCNNCFKGNSLAAKYVEEGRILLAKCNDGNFCRVAVKAVKEDKALIHLFDQGRTIACKFENLHQLPDQLQAVEKHAMQCSLYNIGPLPGPDWPKAGHCAVIDDLFKSTRLDYKVITLENEIAQVSLQINGEDVGDFLVKSGLAKRIKLPQSAPESKPVPTNLTPLRCFNVTSFTELPVIFVSEGVTAKNLCFINAKLTQPMSQLDSVEVGDFIAVKYLTMPNGNPWHRAKLQANNLYYLVDSGITISSPTAIKELPPSIKDMPPLAQKALLPIEPPQGADKFDSSTYEKLMQLVGGEKSTELTCQVIGTSADTLYLDLLTPKLERAASLLEKEHLLVSTLKSVFISHIDFPLTLFVQDNHAQVTWVQEQLEKPHKQLPKVTVGQICACEFEGCKYRAEVLDQQRVRFIDYGNEEDAKIWWQLDPEVAAIPPLCKMRYVKGSDQLSPEENTTLEDLLDFEKEYLAVFVGEEEIVLFEDGKDLVDIAKNSAAENNNEELLSPRTTAIKEEMIDEIQDDPEPVLEVSEVQYEPEPVLEVSEVQYEPEPVLEVSEVQYEPEPVHEVAEEHDEPALVVNTEEEFENTELHAIQEEGTEFEEVQSVEEVMPATPAESNGFTVEIIKAELTPIDEELKALKIVNDQQEQLQEKLNEPIGDTEYRKYFVSSFISTLEFYLQLDPDAVEKLSMELSLQPDFPLADLAQDEMCAGLSDHDGKWGRAQILSLRPPLGFFFDSGRESQIRSFKLLNAHHRNIELLARRCELKDCLTDVVFTEGQWIEAKVDKDGKVELKKEQHWRKAVITHYESHSEFYLRPAEDSPKAMEKQLEEGSDVQIVTIGMMYAAPNGQNGWSRVRVTDIPLSGCSVYYVDYGYYGTALKVKHVVPYWLTRPEIARMCFLQPVPPPEHHERIKKILKPGVEIEVDGLRLGKTAQSVTVRVGGRTLEELLQQQQNGKPELPSVAVNGDSETDLRPDAVDFVPTRNWDAIGCRLVSKYIKRFEDKESKHICQSLGCLMKKASDADTLTELGKDFLQESFYKSRPTNAENSSECYSSKSTTPLSDESDSGMLNGAAAIRTKKTFHLSPAKLIL